MRYEVARHSTREQGDGFILYFPETDHLYRFSPLGNKIIKALQDEYDISTLPSLLGLKNDEVKYLGNFLMKLQEYGIINKKEEK
jgi:hypothetical protein